MEIRGKVALVTGGASGIGLAVAREFVEREVRALALIDRSANVADARSLMASQDLGQTELVSYVGDVRDAGFRQHVFDDLVARFGVPRICVPAAGITRDALAAKLNRETGRAELYSPDDFRLTLEVNLIAPVYWALEMVARIAEDRHAKAIQRWQPDEGVQGTVIFIGSVSSQGNKGQISYAAAKSGLEGAAATLTKEAIYYGVRCGVIHPGYTDTPMVRALGDEHIQQRILPNTQLRRLIRPEEIADAICFMVGNSAVSGQLWADAGWHPTA